LIYLWGAVDLSWEILKHLKAEEMRLTLPISYPVFCILIIFQQVYQSHLSFPVTFSCCIIWVKENALTIKESTGKQRKCTGNKRKHWE